MKKYEIYKVTNLINNKVYIGLTTQGIKKRWYQHCHMLTGSTYLKRAINLYGSQNFIIEVIDIASTEQELQDLEIMYIAEYNSLSPNGYNLTTGGSYCNYSKDITDQMSSIMKTRWQDKEKMKSLLIGIKEYVEKKKQKIIGINIKNGSIIKFTSISDAQINNYFPQPCLHQNSNYSGEHSWFYDEGLSDEEYQELTKIRLGCNFGEYSKGKNSWKKSNKDARIKTQREGSKHRFKAIVSVHIHSGIVIRYANVHDVSRAGFHWGSMYDCIKGKRLTGQKHCWFYEIGESDEYYIKETIKKIGSFDKSFCKPIKATNIKTGIIKIYSNINEVISDGFKVKTIRVFLRRPKKHLGGYFWEYA